MTNPKERNQRMKSIFGSIDTDELSKHVPSDAADAARRRVGSGAVKSMDRVFVSIEEENKRLHDQLTSSEMVVELDPDSVVPSFVKDRLDLEGDPSFPSFVEGIREAGQRLPILVRPLPDRPGTYQAAFGHRRLRACQIIKRPVKAIIRDMTDEELIVSQGVENAERQNLSFIEQALFALELKERQYSRETIARALGREEKKGVAYISFLTNIAAMIPEDLVRKIGTAPGVGRPKWEKLGSIFTDRKLSKSQATIVQSLVNSPSWKDLDSDDRFAQVLDALQSRGSAAKPAAEQVRVIGGVPIGTRIGAKATRLSIPDQQLPGLGAWLLERLPELVEEFKETQRKESEMK